MGPEPEIYDGTSDEFVMGEDPPSGFRVRAKKKLGIFADRLLIPSAILIIIAAIVLSCSCTTTITAADGTKVRMAGDLGFYPTGGTSSSSASSSGLLGGLFGTAGSIAITGQEAQQPSSFEVFGADGRPFVRVRGTYGHSAHSAVVMHATWKMIRSAITGLAISSGIGAYEAIKVSDNAVKNIAARVGADTSQAASLDAVRIAEIEAKKAISLAQLQQ